MRRLISVLVPMLIVLGAGPSAFAAWTSTGSDQGAIVATAVNAGNMPATSRNNGTVPISWAASTLASGDAVGYYDVIRSSGTTAAVVCSGVEATSCIDTAPVPGPVSYSVVPRIGAHWKGASSAGADFTYDNVAPVTSVTTRTPAANEAGWNTGSVSVTLTAVDPAPVASGVKEIHYALDSGEQAVVAGPTATFLVSQEDVTDLTFYAVDYVGNVEGEDSTDSIRIDRTAPVSSGTLTGSTLTLSATDTGGSGVSKIEYKIGSAGTTYSTYGSPLALASGQTVYFHAVDVAGNVESPEHQVTYTAVPTDTTAPVTAVSNSNPAPNVAGWSRADVTLMLTSTDAGSVAKLEWRNGSTGAFTTITGPGPYILPTYTAEGPTTVEFRATDAAGNVEAIKSYTVKIDKTAPLGAISFPSGIVSGNNVFRQGCGTSANSTSSFDICGTASDGAVTASGIAKVEFRLQNAASACLVETGQDAPAFTSPACSSRLTASPATGTYNWTAVTGPIPAGSYTLTVWVTDLAGNESSPASSTFTR